MINRIVFGLIVFVTPIIKGYSQCSNPTVTESEFCTGMRGEIKLTDGDSDDKYHWYRDPDMYDLGYGYADNGRHFVSPADMTAPASFWYRKETAQTIGPTYPAPVGGQDASIDQAAYEMKFDASTDFRLTSVSVPVKVYQNNVTYGLQISIIDGSGTTKYSNWHKFTSTITGSMVKIEVPVNLDVVAGTGLTIRVNSVTDATQGVTKVDEVHWYNTTTYTSTSYAGGMVTVNPEVKSIYSTNRIPVISDWKTTIYCPAQKVDVTLKATGCCTPVGGNIQVSAPTTIVVPSQLPMTLTVSGTDANSANYYQWIKQDGTVVGTPGTNATSVSITTDGIYKVRMAESGSHINSFSCYKEASIFIQKRILFAPEDTTVCAGTPLELVAMGGTGDFKWTPSNYLSDPNSKITTATIDIPTTVTYTVEATVPVGNIVIDGDFDESTFAAPKFETKYNLVSEIPNSSPNNHATIGTRAYAAWGGDFAKFCDDTIGFYSADRGKFLYADAQSTWANPVPSDWGINNYIWQQSNLPVFQNTDYEFRFLVTDWGVEDLNQPAKTSDVQMYVNGQPLLITPIEINKRCRWTEVKAIWNSGSNTSATLTISDVNAQNLGGEFAIDDISFGAPGKQTDQVIITTTDCSTIDVVETIHCQGDSSQIEATTNGLFTGWTAVGGGTTNIVSPANPTTWVRPTVPTKYVGTAQFTSGNLIKNGDFELGDQGFTSDYPYQANLDVGKYMVGTNPNAGFAVNIGDHTTGTGRMFLSDGGSDTTKSPYKTTVTIEAGKQYAFSLWAANIHNEFQKPAPDTTYNAKTAYLAFVIDNEVTGSIKLPLDNSWHQFYTVWTAPANKTITIEVRNRETAHHGNDFALDDFIFAPLSNIKTDTIEILPCRFTGRDIAVEFCETTFGSNNAVVDLTQYKDTITYKNAQGAVASWHTGIPTAANRISNPAASTVTSGKLYAVVTHATQPGDTAEVTVVINPKPNASITTAASALEYCEGINGVTLNATPVTGATYQWKGPVSGTTNPLLNATAGAYKVIVTASNGCMDSTSNVTVVENANPVINITNSGAGLQYCEGTGGVSLTASSDIAVASYSWDGPVTGTANPLTNATEGLYTVSGITAKGCKDTSSAVTVIENPLPTGGNIPASDNVCIGETNKRFTISGATDASDYNWTVPAGASISSDSTGPNTTSITVDFGTASSGNITVTPVNACGNGVTSTVAITYFDKPSGGSITATDPVCEGSTHSVTATAFTNSPDSYTWTLTNATGSSTDAAIQVSYPAAGTASISVTATNSCGTSSAVSGTVTVNPGTGDAGPISGTTTICNNQNGEVYTITPVANATSYEWTVSGDATIAGSSTGPSIVVDFREAASYTITVTPKGICDDGDPSTITVTNGGVVSPTVVLSQLPNPGCSNAPLLVVATGTSWGSSPSFSWTIDGVGDATNNDTLTVINPVHTSVISLTVMSDLSCANPTTAVANLTLAVEPALTTPVVSSQTGLICQNSSGHIFTVTPVPGATSYAWNASAGISLTVAPDQLSAEATISEDAPLTGTISVTATNICGSETGHTTLTITEQRTPDVAVLPDKTILCANESLTFTATITNGGGSPTYVWYRNGVAQPSTTANTFVVNPPLNPAEEVYVVLTSSYECPSEPSIPAEIVTVEPTPMRTATIEIAPDSFGAVCQDSLMVFSANITNGGNSPFYSWTATNATPSTGTGPTFSTRLNQNSTIAVTLTSDQVCITNPTVDDQVSVTVSPKVPVTVSISPVAATCEGEQPALITASHTNGGNPTYTWFVDAVRLSNTGNTLQLPSNLTAGSHSIKVEMASSLSCLVNSQDEEEITHTVNANPTIKVSGDEFYCPGASTILTAQGGDSYQWYLDNGSNAVGSSATLTASAPGTYKLVGTDLNNCKNETTKVIQVLSPEATIASATGSFTTCEGDVIRLIVQETGNQYIWKKDGLVVGGNDREILVTESGEYEVTLTLTGGGTSCTATDREQVNFLPKPSGGLIGDTVICQGQQVVITPTYNNGNIIAWYRGNQNLNTTTPSLAISESGTYYAIIGNGICSTATNSVTISVEEIPVADAGPDKAVTQGESVVLEGRLTGPDYRYEWFSNDYSGHLDSLPITTATPEKDPSKFYLTVTTASGTCTSVDSMVVRIELAVRPWNSFSPNNDNTYDTWIIENIEDYPNALIEVFNRWGSLVWSSKGYANPWDGSNWRNGELLPVATYYYVIYPNGERIRDPLTGAVTIVK